MFKNCLVWAGQVGRALAPLALALLSVTSVLLAGLLWLLWLAVRARNALVVALFNRLIGR